MSGIWPMIDLRKVLTGLVSGMPGSVGGAIA